MDTRKRSGKTPCKRNGCTTGREATYRDMLSDRYASKALCTQCGQAAKERGELVAAQTMWKKAVKRCSSNEAARDDLIKRIAKAHEVQLRRVKAERDGLEAENTRLGAQLATAKAEQDRLNHFSRLQMAKNANLGAKLAAVKAEQDRLRNSNRLQAAENADLRSQLTMHTHDTVDLVCGDEHVGVRPTFSGRGLKRNHVVAQLHGMVHAVKREKLDAKADAEQYEDLAKVLTLTVDERQSYEDELKQQLQDVGIQPLGWPEFRAIRSAAQSI